MRLKAALSNDELCIKFFKKTLENMMFISCKLPHETRKLKSKFFWLLFAFRWFLAQKAIIPAPPIVNLQKKRSEYEEKLRSWWSYLESLLFLEVLVK